MENFHKNQPKYHAFLSKLFNLCNGHEYLPPKKQTYNFFGEIILFFKTKSKIKVGIL